MFILKKIVDIHLNPGIIVLLLLGYGLTGLENSRDPRFPVGG